MLTHRTVLMVKPCVYLLALCLGIFSACSDASIYLDKTRLIFKGKEAGLRIVNEGTSPTLLQVWVDKGNLDAAPERIQVPFTVMSPVFRLDEKLTHQLRVIFTGTDGQLPADRESLFWLNVLEVPAKLSSLKDKNVMQFSFRTRIKLIYRPAGLSDGQAKESYAQLKFNFSGNTESPELIVTNPTPFYQSMVGLELIKAGAVVATVKPENEIIPPYQQQRFSFRFPEGSQSSASDVTYSLIDDDGNLVRLTGKTVPEY